AVGSRPERSAEFAARHELPRVYGSLDDMLGDPEVDAVWICSPNFLHATHIARCAAAGKHILAEKPLATTGRDAAVAIGAAHEARVTLRVGYQHRFRPAHLRLRDLLGAGAVGDIGLFRIHRFWRYPYYGDQDASGPPSWRRSAVESGGWVINDLGSHLIDLMLWLGGPEASLVGAALAAQRFAVETEDTAALLLALGGQGIGIVETSAASASPGSRVEIYGSAGWIRADDTFTGAATLQTSAAGGGTFAAPAALAPYAALVADFVRAVRGQRGVGATGDEAAANVAIVEAACARPVLRRSGA
ncbi:MAG: Gfo/Idh/MocA family oxidoreductase, partial [Candidatus Rokubacteria bacterium]|nr:Gfo/Idh/MocA family oxidoreductase [Candidatus Rokubacteria bacterium]